MSKRILSKGTLVRKCTQWGTPVGDWMEVEMANAHNVYTRYVHHEDLMLLRRDRIWVPRCVRLCISNAKARDILDRGAIVISHPITKLWYDAFKSIPDLIMLYTNDGWYKIHITVDGIYKDGNVIKLVINRVIKSKIGLCN